MHFLVEVMEDEIQINLVVKGLSDPMGGFIKSRIFKRCIIIVQQSNWFFSEE